MAATDLATAALLALAVGADRASVSVQAYSDDDGVSVTTAGASATTERGDVRVSAGWLVDVVSAASVDLVSAASPHGFDETRQSVQAGADLQVAPDAWVGLSAGGSWESDFASRAVSLRGLVELAGRNTTVGLSLQHRQDAVGRTGDAGFGEDRAGERVEATFTQLLDRDTALDLGGTALLERGFLENPYRFVRLELTAVQEEVPDDRLRGGILARMRRRVARATFAALEAQGHGDDWGVRGGSLGARVSQGVTSGLTLTARTRGYVQSGASFWRARYDGAPRLRSSDKELSPMWSALAGLRLELDLALRPFDRLTLDAGVDVLDLHYPEHPTLPRRTATVGSAGVEVEF